MHLRWALPVGLAVVLLAGCATTPSSNMSFAATPPPDRIPYAGTLATEGTASKTSKSVEKAGAAGTVVRCSAPPTGAILRPGSRQPPANSPEEAIDTYVSSELPVRKLARERNDHDRVLFTTTYRGLARQAVTVRRADPSTDAAAADHDGWYVESYAYCDLADFPEAVSAAAGIGIWTDVRGVRQPTTTIQSYQGAKHCALQDTRFLTLGDARTGAKAYVDKIPPAMQDNFADQPRPHVTVPRDATDTGFTRNQSHLWLSKDRTRAYIGTPTDADLWPRELQAFGCA